MNSAKLCFCLMLCLAIAIPCVAFSEDGEPSQFPSRTELGFSIGTPAAGNLEIEHHASVATFGFSGMRYSTDQGFQFSIAPSRLRSANGSRRIQFIVGHSRLKSYESGFPFRPRIYTWDYVGVEFVWRPKRLLLAIGLTAGEGDYSTPQISGRIGLAWVVHRRSH